MQVPRMAMVAAVALSLLAVAVVPGAAAAPTAKWTGTTSTFVCAQGYCQILSAPVDDESVNVGTGDFRQVKFP